MAALSIVSGRSDLGRRLARAVGVKSPWQKVVIEIDCQMVIKVYAVMLAETDGIEKVCDEIEAVAVQGVTVDDHATVHVVEAK